MPGLLDFAEQNTPATGGLLGFDEGRRVFGYPIRSRLYDGEDSFFKKNPHVSGMAAEDGAVILNPYTKLSQQELAAVAKNEAARLHMRQNNIVPEFQITQKQNDYFAGTPYQNADKEKRQTIVARILSGDPSVSPTPEQTMEARRIAASLIGD